jgi:hypothetical protein
MTPLRSLLRSVRRRLGLDVPPFYRRYPPRFPVSVIDFRISIDHAARFCYFRIPKAANTTIIARLYMEQNGLREVDPSRLPDIKLNGYTRPSRLSRAEVDRVMSSYFRFTFVRNPYVRVLSAYFDKIAGRDERRQNMVRNALGRPDGSSISFTDFLDYLEHCGGLGADPHWAPQAHVITVDARSLDFVGKVERLAADLDHVLTRLFGKACGDPGDFTENRTGAAERLGLLDQAASRRIHRLYEEDFDTFRYASDPARAGDLGERWPC